MRPEVLWCIQKLQEAHDDYSMADAKAYLELLVMWLNKETGGTPSE